MYILEIVLIATLLLLLIAQNLRSIDQKISLTLFVVAFVILLLGIILGQARWQMTPVYLLFVILSLLLMRRSYSHLAIRSLGIMLGLLLLGIGVVLAISLPIVSLPAPGGPYVVGSQHFSLTDESRNEDFFGLPNESRELSLRVWYPGTLSETQDRPRLRTLWQDLYRGTRDPVTMLTGYMRGIETHSYQDIPVAMPNAPYPVIVFSHSLALPAEQNTPLMEHLASHGYMVIGVNHSRMTLRVIAANGQVIPLHPERLQEAFNEGASVDDDDVAALLAEASSAEERVDIVLGLAERTPGINAQIAVRVADLRFVMDSIATPPVANPDFVELMSQVNSGSIGLIGMSVGGAAVIETCKIDMRCQAGLNLDGGIFGNHPRKPLAVPFLSMVSQQNQIFDEPLLLHSRNDYYEVLLEGAGHGDFSDMSFLMPFMKWLGANGSITPERVIEVMNEVSLQFFDAYLREAAKPQFDTVSMPEIRITTNVQAN